MPNDARMQILYYKENADVLLEFGLQGNYSMRLLTVHTEDYKSFLQQLSKAVGRNSIILTVGGFGRDDRLPEILGRSIGQELSTPPVEEFRITQPMHTLLPKDSIPLVSANGTLAGCVIEKGLQSIIMLTDDATLRRQVLKELVIPYIGERLRCITGAPAKPTQPQAVPAEPAAQAPAELAPAPAEDVTSPVPKSQVQETPKVEPPIQAPAQDVFSFSAEPEAIFSEDELPSPRRHGGGRIIATILCIVLAAALVLGACGLLYYVLQQKQQEAPGEKVFLYQTVCPDTAENERVLW